MVYPILGNDSIVKAQLVNGYYNSLFTYFGVVGSQYLAFLFVLGIICVLVDVTSSFVFSQSTLFYIPNGILVSLF